MLDLGSWSFGRVAMASVLWVALDVAVVAVYVYLKFRSQWQSAGSGGIGAVIGAIHLLMVILVLFGPPILLTVTWWLKRRS